jgi:hypothetical protein
MRPATAGGAVYPAADFYSFRTGFADFHCIGGGKFDAGSA